MNSNERWVLITGASAGLGQALAFEFAANGFNLLLIARNKIALEEVAAKCRNLFGVRAEVFVYDLSDLIAINQLIGKISGRQIDILINNAGFGVKGNFAETDLDAELQLVNLQLAALLKLTKAVLPGMIERQSGKILNVASVYSFAPVPQQAVYSACKAFMFSFSAALQNELQDSGVAVTVLCPGVTQTEFRQRAGIFEKNKNAGITAETVAKIAFQQTMLEKKVVIPGALNKLFVFLARHLPPDLLTAVMKIINNRRGTNAA